MVLSLCERIRGSKACSEKYQPHRRSSGECDCCATVSDSGWQRFAELQRVEGIMGAVVRQLPMEHTVLNTVRISLLANGATDCGHLQVSFSCQPVQQAVEVIRGEVKSHGHHVDAAPATTRATPAAAAMTDEAEEGEEAEAPVSAFPSSLEKCPNGHTLQVFVTPGNPCDGLCGRYCESGTRVMECGQ